MLVSRDVFCVFNCIGDCGYLELFIVMVRHIEVVLSREQIDVLHCVNTGFSVKDLC